MLLRSDSVYLRPLERGDLARTHQWINHPELYVIMGVFGPRSADEQDQWFTRLLGSRRNLVFALCRSEDDVHIGNVSLFDIDYLDRNAGLTIFIANQEDRSKGLGRMAVWLACDYAFRYLNLHKVYCKTDNPAAERLYQGLGFRREGVQREHSFQGGAYVDKVLFGVLRGELKIPAGSDQGGA